MIRSPYLDWAMAQVGRARFDLATSGARSVPFAELGPLPALDDPGALARAAAAVARHHDVPEARVVPALGTSHALFLAAGAVLSPGDEALVERPTYDPLAAAARAHGADVRTFERGPAGDAAPTRAADDGGDFALSRDAVLAALSPRTRLVVVSELHNPTGARTPEGEVDALADALAARGVHLLVDEVYAPFDRLEPDGRFLASAHRRRPSALAVGSLTKVFGLGHARLGWLLAPEDAAAHARSVLLATTGWLGTAHGALLAHGLAHARELGARSHEGLAARRARVAAWVVGRDDVRWSAPASGLSALVWPRRANAERVVDEAFAREGVRVVPGRFFGVPDAFRVAWSAHDDALAAGLEGLGRVLDALG